MNKRNKNLLRIAFVVLIMASIGVIIKSNNQDLKNVSIGVFGSLLGAFLYSFILNSFNKDTQTEIQELLYQFQNKELNGIKAVREKFKYEPNFWISILKSSQTELVLMGHTLSKWLEEPYKEVFLEQLPRIVNKGGQVKILIMESEFYCQIHDLKEIKSIKKLDETKKYLNMIKSKIKKDKQNKFLVKELPVCKLPFMFLKTNTIMLMSPYYADKDNVDNILFDLESDSKLGISYFNDFESVFKVAKNVNLEQCN